MTSLHCLRVVERRFLLKDRRELAAEPMATGQDTGADDTEGEVASPLATDLDAGGDEYHHEVQAADQDEQAEGGAEQVVESVADHRKPP